MTKITVLANCQAGPLGALLRQANQSVEILNAPRVHQLQNGNDQIALDCVKKAEIVLHQPLSDRFGALETDELRRSFPEKHFVSFPSIFFGGLFPQLVYLRLPKGGTLKGPLTDYHDSKIVGSFLNDETVDQCLDRMMTTTPEEIAQYEAALSESRRRDLNVDLPIMDVIQEQLAAEPPLFTFNHPVNAVLWSVAKRTLELLDIPVGIDASQLPKRQYLGGTSAMIPNGIPEYLGVGWRRDHYELDGQLLINRELVNSFYELYAGTENFLEICQFNKSRFNLAVQIPH